MIDRRKPPKAQAIKPLKFPKPLKRTLSNDAPMHIINIGEQPAARLEIIFEASGWHEKKPLTASFASRMLQEGTESFSSTQLSEAFDELGAFVETDSNADYSSITVHCLSKFLPKIMPMVREMMHEATFPEKEWKTYQNISLQNLKVNLEDNAWLVNRMFRNALFGDNHPYSFSFSEADIHSVSKDDAHSFYQKNIKAAQFQAFLAGRLDQVQIDEVANALGAGPHLKKPSAKSLDKSSLPEKSEDIYQEKPDSLQSSIRVGRRLFTRTHPDFIKAQVANEVLGGFFGSRLMKSIREEKGFTYGIWSQVISFQHAGYFAIGTNVKKEFTSQTLDEISRQIRLLQTEKVKGSELNLVKNFMAGEFVGSLSTAFEVASKYKTAVLNNLPEDYYQNYLSKIMAVTSEDILRIASEYWKPDDLVKLIVG